MRVLLDEDTPRWIRRFLPGHYVRAVQQMGWAEIKYGAMLNLAEQNGFDVLVTFDRNIPHQQYFASRTIAVIVVVVPNKAAETITPLIAELKATLSAVEPGTVSYVPPRP